VYRWSSLILNTLYAPIPTIPELEEFVEAARAANLDPDWIADQVARIKSIHQNRFDHLTMAVCTFAAVLLPLAIPTAVWLRLRG
jgi:hypothetical protein